LFRRTESLYYFLATSAASRFSGARFFLCPPGILINSNDAEVQIAIIGSGFGGIGTAILLQQEGFCRVARFAPREYVME
jgi:hypothetical protein